MTLSGRQCISDLPEVGRSIRVLLGGSGGTDGFHAGHHCLKGGASTFIIQHMHLCEELAMVISA